MSNYTKEIINYIDNNLSKEDTDKFIVKLENNKELKEEYLLVLKLNEHMKGKLLSESIENDENYKQVEKLAKDDISNFLNSEKDQEILDYLSLAFPEKNNDFINEMKELENESENLGIDDITEDWVNELENKKNIKDIPFIKKKTNYKQKIDKGRKKLYLWTASVAAILALVFILNNVFNSLPQNESLFSEYHKNPEELLSIQVRGTNQNVNFEKARALYKQKSYNEAFAIFNKLAKKDTNFVQALYYSGLTQFEAGNYNNSIEIFNKVISNFADYELEGKWFISLAYIKTNKFEEAIPFLQDLAKQKSIYQRNSKNILEQIEE